MKKISQILFLAAAFSGLSFTTTDDRGKKGGTKKVLLNVHTNTVNKGNIFTNPASGLKYTGTTVIKISGKNIMTASTFQKGNTVYIQQQKRQVFVPEVRQGYTGVKLIIKTH